MMSLEVEHRNATGAAKEHLRNMYQSHRTHLDQYDQPACTGYDCTVYRMVHGIARYVLKFQGEESLRYYVNTTGTEWQSKDS